MTTTGLLGDFFIVGLTSYFLHDRLRAISRERQFRYLEFANYVLTFIFVVVDVASSIMDVELSWKYTVCETCHHVNCEINCLDVLWSASNKSVIMHIVGSVLYALIAWYWFVLAIICLVWGKTMRLPFPVRYEPWFNDHQNKRYNKLIIYIRPV
jgi:hypothetical protein